MAVPRFLARNIVRYGFSRFREKPTVLFEKTRPARVSARNRSTRFAAYERPADDFGNAVCNELVKSYLLGQICARCFDQPWEGTLRTAFARL